MQRSLNLFRIIAMEMAGHVNGLDAEDAIKINFIRDLVEHLIAWATESAAEVPVFLMACLK
jgi:hypothetical protein